MENKTPIKKRKKNKKKLGKSIPNNFYKTSINNSPINKNTNSKNESPNKDNSDNIEKNKIITTNSDNKKEQLKGNEIRKFENIYSPRTSFIKQLEKEEKLLQDLRESFDP